MESMRREKLRGLVRNADLWKHGCIARGCQLCLHRDRVSVTVFDSVTAL